MSQRAYGAASGQGFTRQTYHDPEKKKIKEVYQVKDTLRNVAHGRYTSYFVNGGVESKGQFENNETTVVWEFYYETAQNAGHTLQKWQLWHVGVLQRAEEHGGHHQWEEPQGELTRMAM